MKKLFQFIKPYWPNILLTVVLLFIMTNTDLALPDYLSRIINVGIQQNGIENAVPEALRKSTMDQINLFQSEEEKAQTLAAYQLVEPGTDEAAKYVPDYPLVSLQPVYILQQKDSATITQLEAIMTKPLILTFGIDMLSQNPEQAATLLGPEFAEQVQSLPPGTDLKAMLFQLPPAQLEALKTTVYKQLDALEPSMLTQIAVQAVSQEYSVLGVNLASIQNKFILNVGGLMILMALISVITSISVSYLSARTAAGVARDTRIAVFEKVENFSSAEFNNFSTSSLITRTTNDIAQIQIVIFMIMRMALNAPIMGIGAVLRAIDKSANMWWLIALAVVVLTGMIMIAFALVMPKFRILQSLIDRLNLVIRENLTGLMVVRAFRKEEYEEKRFEKANRDLANTNVYIGRVLSVIFPFINLIMSGLSILIIWVGAHEVAQSALQVGDLIAFMQYSMQIMFSFISLAMLFIILPRASVSGERIAEVLETPIVIQDPPHPLQFSQPVRGELVFDDVDFRYPGAEEDLLHDISFIAKPGETTSIIGSTGSGKSTLVNLVPRFFDVSKGSILIDGIDIRDVTLKDLRAQIGYVPQRGVLFSGTIESNMRLAKPDATVEEIMDALDTAQAIDFVMANPDGLQTEVAQGGTNFSGGQKQRLSIARALVKKPPIYIFDDSFSALDFKTDAALRSALSRKVGNSTVLIVTQRVATAKNSDQILVLDNGRIAGVGTHQELMKTCTVYQEIASSQLSKEELL
jgi:ATP-binding cassette subfamily B protein